MPELSMSSALLILLAAAATLVVVGSVAAVMVALRAGRDTERVALALDVLADQLELANRTLHTRLDGAAGEMNRTLALGLQQATEALSHSIGRAREDTRATIDEKFLAVSDRLGDLKATNDRIIEFSRSLDELQRVLQSPKLRGNFGEFTLEQMLAEVIPSESYELQAPLGMGRVDALLRTPHGVLCVDSKFPLDNFRRALDADDTTREAAMKSFCTDVKSRVVEIAERYVRPPTTLEMALMFVPAENVYYELLTRPDLMEFCRERRVIPVSPNSMYAYLQALAIGFRGLKIHQEARRVEQLLGDLRTRFERFRDHFGKLGRHLEAAQGQYTSASRHADRFQTTLEGLRVGRVEEEESTVDREAPAAEAGAPAAQRSFLQDPRHL
jgi:DNA recombination protein RmuC